MCWLVVSLNWFRWFAKSENYLWLLDFSKQSPTHDLLDIRSEGCSSILDRRYSFTLLLHSSTTVFTSASQTLSYNRSPQPKCFISCSCKFTSYNLSLLVFPASSYSYKNFSFVQQPCYYRVLSRRIFLYSATDVLVQLLLVILVPFRCIQVFSRSQFVSLW